LKELEKTILSKAREKKNAAELALASGVPIASIMSVLEGLKEKGFANVETKTTLTHGLTQEGADAAVKGLPEKKLLTSLAHHKTMPIGQLREQLLSKSQVEDGISEQEFGIALQWAKAFGLIAIEKGNVLLKEQKKTPHEALLQKIGKGILEEHLTHEEKTTITELKRRGLVEEKISKEVYAIATAKGIEELEAERSGSTLITQLTPQMLKSGDWKDRKFAEYDVRSGLHKEMMLGKKHAYKQLLLEIKQKLVGMGFAEEHGPLVEMEFWNMDALFMAQDHPAREIHDVFQVEDPARGEILDKKLLANVRKAHEHGLEGSKGWAYKWDPEVAARLVLRSQTTTVSARNLAKGLKPPKRIFCIGRVFRPDEIDWKHFIEFNQCEGIVLDEKMSFRELLGYLKEFAVEVFGAKEVQFQPSYFPFTEPSVEMYVNIPGRGWAEVGGAGMFRPEMLSALGVKVPVLAWGLGIDRLAMIKLGLKDIRDLFTQDLKKLRS